MFQRKKKAESQGGSSVKGRFKGRLQGGLQGGLDGGSLTDEGVQKRGGAEGRLKGFDPLPFPSRAKRVPRTPKAHEAIYFDSYQYQSEIL